VGKKKGKETITEGWTCWGYTVCVYGIITMKSSHVISVY
jgi:hypothetical protein